MLERDELGLPMAKVSPRVSRMQPRNRPCTDTTLAFFQAVGRKPVDLPLAQVVGPDQVAVVAFVAIGAAQLELAVLRVVDLLAPPPSSRRRGRRWPRFTVWPRPTEAISATMLRICWLS